jgi:hypothetical protein
MYKKHQILNTFLCTGGRKKDTWSNFLSKKHFVRIYLTLILLLVVFPSVAQERSTIFIEQYVKNSFTKYGIHNALVTVMDSAGNVIDTVRTQKGSGGQDAQMWSLTVPRKPTKFRIRAEHPDYVTGEMTIDMKHPARLNSFQLPDMLLKIKKFDDNEVQLGEVVIQATRVKMCYKGDTIEVDARAFKLSEGSMLDALVRNVPGCELRDNGEIYMNGKKVDYLTLNGKEFFKGNNKVMLDNLPYYTVDKLQFYNQQSERSALMGKDVEKQDYVMNVKMKREYSVGILGNVEVAGGTHNRWLGRAFGLRFTDNSRLTLFANANNVNESKQPGTKGDWENAASTIGDNKLYNAGGELMIDDKHWRYKEQADADVSWVKSRNETRTTSETFMPDGSVFDRLQQTNTLHNFHIKANNNLTLKHLGMISRSHFTYDKDHGDAWKRTGRFTDNPADYGNTTQVLDSIFCTTAASQLLRLLVNRTKATSNTHAHRWNAQQNFTYHKELPWGDDIVLNADGEWSDAKNHSADIYNQEIFSNGISKNFEEQNRVSPGFNHSQDYKAGASYSFHFLNQWHLTLSDVWHQRRQVSESNLYRLDWDETYVATGILPSMIDYARVQDKSNSWHSVNNYKANETAMTLHTHKYDSKKERYTSFTLTLPANYTITAEDYRRAERNTHVTDYRWLFNPSVNWEYNTRHWRDTYVFNYKMDMRSPDLTQKVDFTDTSDPLRILQGNPELQPSQSHDLSFTFSSRLNAKHRQFVVLRSGITVLRNLMAQSVAYNTLTGAYTYRPINVNGNWNWQNSLGYRRSLDENSRFSMEERSSFDYFRNVDVKTTVGSGLDERSRVNQYVTSQDLKLEYKYEKWQVAILGQAMWNRLNSSPSPSTNINSIDYNYGFTTVCELPWTLLFSTDMKMYSRRGYSESSLNTNNLLWNAQLERNFYKGRFTIAIKAFDLLHQISQTRTVVNSQGRMETWQLSLPSYVMIHLRWKFHKLPSNKTKK